MKFRDMDELEDVVEKLAQRSWQEGKHAFLHAVKTSERLKPQTYEGECWNRDAMGCLKDLSELYSIQCPNTPPDARKMVVLKDFYTRALFFHVGMYVGEKL